MSRKMMMLLVWSALLVLAVLDVSCSGSDTPQPNDCSKSDLAVAPDAPTNPTACDAANGSITVTPSGGEEPYTFSKDGTSFQASATFNNLGPGTYIIAVKDKKGCIRFTDEIALAVPGLVFNVATTVVSNTGCLTTESNGSITVNATGDNGPFQFKLGAAAYSDVNVFNQLAKGVYQLKVKNSVGCEMSVSVTVAQGKTGITYNGTVKEILTQKCQFASCHPSNGDWFTYSVAKTNATAIKSRTSGGSMPPSGAPGGALSETQKAQIACWANDGAPEN